MFDNKTGVSLIKFENFYHSHSSFFNLKLKRYDFFNKVILNYCSLSFHIYYGGVIYALDINHNLARHIF